MGCFQSKRNRDRLRSLRADAFRGPGRIGFHSSHLSLLRSKERFLRGLRTRGTALSFVPSKTICYSRRTRNTSAALHRTKKIDLYFRGVTALRSPRLLKLLDAVMNFFHNDSALKPAEEIHGDS